MTAEFKINRLRFIWQGTWSATTIYARDTIVEYNGKSYACLTPHTASSNFYSDLNHTDGGAAAPRWELVVDGKVWKNAWTPTTFYSLGNIVRYGGVVYICTVPHTSGSSLNVSNFTTLTTFANWNNIWTTDYNYGIGDIVRYGGIVYICTVGHTSASSISSGLEADQGKWTVVSSGVEYRGNWNSTSPVTFVLNSVIEKLDTAPIHIRFAIDNQPTVPSTSTFYNVTQNSNVNYNQSGLVSTSATNNTLMLTYLSDPGEFGTGTTIASTPGATSIRYKLNDIVKYGPSLWICTNGHTSGSTFDPNWELFSPGQEFITNWSPAYSYALGDVVTYGGYTFVSSVTNNTGNIPSTISSQWTLLVPGVSIKSNWSSTISYKLGDIVKRNGQVYKAVTNNANIDPSVAQIATTYTASGSSGTTLIVNSTFNIVLGMNIIGAGFNNGQSVVAVNGLTSLTISDPPNSQPTNGQPLLFVGVNSPAWTLLVPGVNWTFRWAANTPYVIGDVVLQGNATYRCIQNHIGLSLNRPDLDITNSYWTVYTLHARNNVMTELGSTITYLNGSTTALAIGENNNILQSNGSQLSWNKILTTNNVFYVATNGEDSLSNGTTWDKPWKTIAYACQRVALGTQNPNSAFLLSANKNFLVAEMYNYMIWAKTGDSQTNGPVPPFTPSSTFDQAKTIRDANYVIDAIIYDISRGGNSQTVAATLAYFYQGTTNTFINTSVADQMPFFIAGLTYLLGIVNDALNNVTPVSYQVLNNVVDPYTQVLNSQIVAETAGVTSVNLLFSVLITALTNQSTTGIPTANTGITASIMVKTGTFDEMLPISVPANVALVGDELRGVVVQPKRVVNTFTSSSDATNDTFTVFTTEDLYDNCPVQFVSVSNFFADLVEFETNITPGQTYYVIGSSITPTSFSVSSTPLEYITNPTTLVVTIISNIVTLAGGLGRMQVIGGDAIKNMFLMRNGSGLRNMTLNGLLGTLTEENQYLTRRPTGGAYVSLDPGTGPGDTSAWIYRRSPYIQNITTFGIGCIGCKIDGTLHNGGNKSIVSNDFTQILSDGVGVWCTGPGSLTELISVFSYYNYASYFAENGGRIRAANGNSSYGTYGVIAEGFDDTESPITGNVYNISGQATASVQSSFGLNANLLKIQYPNAGTNYHTQTTNMISYSNLFTNGAWTSDGNLSLQQNITGPYANTNAWTVTATSSSAGTGYISQAISINPAGGTYSGLAGSNIGAGGGSGATFTIAVNATSYSITAITGSPAGGSGYVSGNQIRILGSSLGGVDGTHDATITVQTLLGSAIATASIAGTVPGSASLNYTSSLYIKYGTVSSISLVASYSGTSTTNGHGITYNFNTNTTSAFANNGSSVLPTDYGIVNLNNGWYRMWFSGYDNTALNNSLTLTIYSKGQLPTGTGYTYVYGSQIEIDSTLGFYLTSTNRKDSAYADYIVSGAGAGAVLVGDETRSNSIFQTRVIDTGIGAGGAGYLTASNNAQYGDTATIQLAQSDNGTASSYRGLRVFINSGTGAGQYGFISYYTPSTKIANVLKESFATASINSASSSTNLLSLDPLTDFNTIYLNQPVQFFPTYYSSTITQTSISQVTITASVGGVTNTFTTSATARLYLNMPVTFSGTLFGGVTTDFTYYVVNIINATTFQISTNISGSEVLLVSSSGSMTMNIPSNTGYVTTTSTASMVAGMTVEFIGTNFGQLGSSTYHVTDVIDATHFTISSALLTLTASNVDNVTNEITVDNSANFIILNPITFSGTSFGGLTAQQKYYIKSIPDSTHITVCSSIISATITATEASTNLITASSTAGFLANSPIVFTGISLDGIVPEQVYYVLAVNNGTTFTISTSPGGSAVSFTGESGYMIVKTATATTTFSAAAGTMTGISTPDKLLLTSAFGTMTDLYYSTFLSGLTAGQTYYVLAKNSGTPNTISLTATNGGTTPVTLTTSSIPMSMGTVGWDHVNPGSTIQSTLDGTTIYFIEPRLTYSSPAFSQSTTTLFALPLAFSYVSVGYGNNYFIAVASGSTSLAGSSNGTSWTGINLPTSASWTDIAYGNKFWVLISSGGSGNSRVLYSTAPSQSWKSASLPSVATWNQIVFGNATFVVIDGAVGSDKAAYSTTYGATWSSATLPSSTTWTGLTYGLGKFVAVASGGTAAAYSSDNGATWTASGALPRSTTWSAVAFGNGRFVAISSSSGVTAYSFDGITWSPSIYSIAADKLSYGQGVFVALNSANSTAYTSEDGINWKVRTVTNDSYAGIAFGYTSSTYNGLFVTVAGQSTGSTINAGATAKGRPQVSVGVIGSVSLWEPGSGYTTAPTLSIFDTNVSSNVSTSLRVGNGVLANPSFYNTGTGYSTTSTSVLINGNGYANEYQTNLTLVLNNLSKQPSLGDNLVIAGNSNIYKVSGVTILNNTTAPNITASLQVSPALSILLAPDHETSITIREKYSQARLSNHDFLNVGFGDQAESNYPGLPSETVLAPQNQTIENNYGRVFYTSTDQDGNFKVGTLFGVEQATGIVTLSASQFGLSGLTTLRLGGITVGGSGVLITQISTDATMVANSDNIISTQKAIKSYVSSRLSQGGANSITGQASAGTVVIGGPNRITSTVPQGQAGSSVRITNRANFQGSNAGVDGNMMALNFFINNSTKKTGLRR